MKSYEVSRQKTLLLIRETSHPYSSKEAEEAGERALRRIGYSPIYEYRILLHLEFFLGEKFFLRNSTTLRKARLFFLGSLAISFQFLCLQ